MKPQKILEALSILDPSNNDHWTAEGQPRTGAVGDGVSRSQIQSVAPLFTRSNPVLPGREPEPTDEEVVQTLEEELKAIHEEKLEANAALIAANKARLEAEKAIKDAEARLEKIRTDERNSDPRTDAEINIDYLKSEFNQRLSRAVSQSQARALLESAGLGAEVKGLTVSPIDRAIAARVIAARKQRLAGK
jgi:hypothetical protein